MLNARRLATIATALAAVSLMATQLVSAAPAYKVGTTYFTTGGVTLPDHFAHVIATMTVPAGRYHVTASFTVDNKGEPPSTGGPAIDMLYCSLFAYGVDVQIAQISVPAAGYGQFVLDGPVDATKAVAPGAYMDVECSDPNGAAPFPYIYGNLSADAVAGIVNLQP